MNDFNLNISQLMQIAEEFEKKVKDGLSRDKREIRCFPTYISSINLPDNGETYVIDLGGTNVRAAIVSFEKRKFIIKKGPCEQRMPWECNKVLERKIYLDIQSKALQSLDYSKECPLGYCFSYPAKSTFDGDAELIKWTKKINVPGVVGENVGHMLLKHLKENFKTVKCSTLAVINDTIASLIAGLVKPKVDANIGLIVGTGVNMATFIDTENIPKLKKLNIKGIIPVNLESGNFTPPFLTKWDEIVDKKSQNTGEQRFEKAVSGAYLGNIFKQVHPDSNLNPDTGAEGLAEILNNPEKYDDDYVLTASQIFNRSAKLTAASLAGLIKLLNSYKTIKTIRIVAEGSLFWAIVNGQQHYLSVTQSTLKSLLKEFDLGDISFEFENIRNANLIGSAIAALVK